MGSYFNIIYQGTWRSLIDYFCIGKKWQSSLLDVRAYRGADIGYDHYLVMGRVKVRLSADKNQVRAKRT